MYTEFFGLDALPFELNPDPKYLLMTARHREALANLQYGISARKSLTLMTGEAGTGKTTLIHAALLSPSCRDARIVHLSNSMLTRDEFVQFLARSFQLSDGAGTSKSVMLGELEGELRRRRESGITTALVIDEAQCLDRELLEEIRLLSNIETANEKLLPLVLVGQPEFAERLNLPSLRQLKQRVALRCALSALDEVETAAYIDGRIRIAGGEPSIIFSREAKAEIHRAAQGIPRTISVICDNALVNGFAVGVKPITPAIVLEVSADFDLERRAVSTEPKRSPAPAAVATARTTEHRTERPSTPVVVATPTAPNEDALFSSFGKKRRFSFF